MTRQQCEILKASNQEPSVDPKDLRMLKAMDVAPEPFAFAPLLIILLLAGVASVVAIVLVRVLRKGRS